MNPNQIQILEQEYIAGYTNKQSEHQDANKLSLQIANIKSVKEINQPAKEINQSVNQKMINQLQKQLEKNPVQYEVNSQDKIRELKQQYYKFFKNFIPNPEKYVPKIPSEEEFKRHKIKYLHGNQYYSNLHSYDQTYIKIKNTERQGSIVNYTVIISMFKLEITLLNINQNGKNQKNKIGSGSFGSVRIQSQNKRLFAVKRQMFTKQDNMNEFKMMANKYEINQVIKQLAIYKICSLFKIGPAVETDIGFDLICYKDCIQFQIELCLPIQKWLQNEIFVQKSKFEKEIKQCLLTLHLFRIIHKDIKVQNILFSVKYNKYVLTDFGISHPVIEKIGYRSKTPREGTQQYMSEQMIKIGQYQIGYIHLYGNDIHSLGVVLKKKMTNQNLQKRIKFFKQSKQYQNVKYEYEYLKLKYYCIKPDSKMQEVQNYWKCMNINTLNQLIGIVDKSIEYDKIKSVYNYLSKQQKFKDYNLDSLRIQSQSIKSLKIEPNIKQNTQLQLKNMLRVYGYTIEVRDIIIKLKLQQKHKQTLKIIHKVLDYQKYDYRDIMFGNFRNIIKKIKQCLPIFQQNQYYQVVFKIYMIILQYGNRTEQLETIEKLKKIKYERKKQEEFEQKIRVIIIKNKKDQIEKFIQWMDNKKQKEKILKEKKLYNDIAKIYEQVGKYETALRYYTKSLNMDSFFHGQQHPTIATAYNNIASIYDKMGKYETALTYSTKSLNMDILFHGQQHPNITIRYNNIGRVHGKMGKYEIALTYYTKSLNIDILFHGQRHPNIASIYNNIADVYGNIGNYEIALTYYTKSLNIDILFHGQRHPNIAITYNNIAIVYDSMGQYEIALKYFIKSLNMDRSFHGQHHPTIAATYNGIAGVYNKIGNYETALTYSTKSLNMDILFYGQKHPNIAIKYNNIAINYLSLSKLIQAQKYIYKSISISFNLFKGTTSPLIANNYYTLSNIFLKRNKFIKSLQYSYLALDTFLKFNPLDHPQSPNIISSLAQTYYQMNRFIQSYFFYRLSCQILVRYFPIHHTNVRNAKHMMNEMEWSMPQSIHNYTSNIQFIDNINSKYSQLPKHKLIKVLFAKKWQLRFEFQHKSIRDIAEYLKCEIEIYLCYKYLGYLREKKKISEQAKEVLSRFEQSQQKSMFRELIQKISHQQ